MGQYNRMNMLKRPLEDTPTGPSKKLRFEDLQSELDGLLVLASQHHEEARLAAVDSAFDLEESCKCAEEKMNSTEKELSESKSKRDTCAQYRQKIMDSPAAKMLEKVSGSDVHGVDTLTEDHEKLKSSLEKLSCLVSGLDGDIVLLEKRLDEEKTQCETLRGKHEEAEAKAEKITSLCVVE